MKYELMGKNDYLLDPITTVLNNRGIEDVDSFLKLDKSVINDWRLLKNILVAADCLLSHIEKKSKIYVQIDSDCDGFTSCSILINYLTALFPDINIVWKVPKGKEHGVEIDQVTDDINLVIIPDAGSNQFKEHKQLKERGIDVIVLDHHECSEESRDAIVVNSQISPDYPNKTLTGAGIVYKFCQALDCKLNKNYADYYLDLVAVGNIGDMADSRNLESRYYMIEGLKKINNSFLKAIIDKQSYSMGGKVNIVNVQFYVVPLINGAIRAGTMEDKENMMKAFLESDEKMYYKRNDEYQDMQTFMARTIYNLKNKQNRERDKGVAAIEERIREKDLDKNKIMIVNVTDILGKKLGGLVANQLCKLYKRPVLLVREKKGEEGVFGGSARGYENGHIKDLKQFLTDTRKFIMCEGHPNAHGIEIEADRLIEVNDLINEQLKDVEIDTDVYDVDFVIPSSQLNEKIIRDIHDLRDIWGFKVEAPILTFKDIEVNKDDLLLQGAKKNTFKFKHKGIEFIKFRYNEEEFNELFSKEGAYVIDVVGKCSMNEYNGTVTPQVLMEDFNVVEVKKKQWNF